MNFDLIEEWFLKSFSKSKVRSDFLDYLEKIDCFEGSKFSIQVDHNTYEFEGDLDVELISRVVQFDYYPKAVEIRILAAIGGVVGEANGISTPRFFFAKLYYGGFSEPFNIEMSASQFDL